MPGMRHRLHTHDARGSRATLPHGVIAAALTLSVALTAAQAPAISARDVWVREARQSRSETAAFGVLTNTGTADRALVSAAADMAEKVELHETRMDGGMMRMMPVARIVIPAGGRVELKPGGLHLMLFGVSPDAKQGTTAAIRLTLDDGTTLSVPAPVRAAEEGR